MCKTEILWHVDTAKKQGGQGLRSSMGFLMFQLHREYLIPWVWSRAVQLSSPEEICSWDPALRSTQRSQAVTQGLVWRLSWHRHSPSTMYPCTPFPRRAEPHGRSREKPSFAGIYTHRLVTACKGKVQWDCSSAGNVHVQCILLSNCL